MATRATVKTQITKYKEWLRERFTLDTLNTRFSRRYRRWEDVEPPRSDQNVVEMLLYREFHYENLADHLQWMVDEVEQIDPHHEVRSHGGWSPRPWDERCARIVDSWGMSMSSNNLLTSDDPVPDCGSSVQLRLVPECRAQRALVE